jgi:hypothetical protein
MKRHSAIGLGLVTVLLAVTGCTSNPAGYADRAPRDLSPASASPSGPSAREELLAALARTRGASFRFSASGDMPDGGRIRATGAFDAEAKQYDASIRITGGKDKSAAETLVIGTDLYNRQLNEKQWLHADLRKAKGQGIFSFDPDDPAGIDKWIKGIGSVTRTGPTTYSGQYVADLFKPAVPIGAPAIYVAGLTPVLDFTVKTDAQRWVTSITFDLKPTDGAPVHVTTTLTAHGAKLGLKRPSKSLVREGTILF